MGTEDRHIILHAAFCHGISGTYSFQSSGTYQQTKMEIRTKTVVKLVLFNQLNHLRLNMISVVSKKSRKLLFTYAV